MGDAGEIVTFVNSRAANQHGTRRNVHMPREWLFISLLEKEKLDDWGEGYDICPDCGAVVKENTR